MSVRNRQIATSLGYQKHAKPYRNDRRLNQIPQISLTW